MKQVISIRLEQSTIDKLKAQADKEHRSLSNYVGILIEQAVNDKAVKDYAINLPIMTNEQADYINRELKKIRR